jgi:hypothetical protein
MRKIYPAIFKKSGLFVLLVTVLFSLLPGSLLFGQTIVPFNTPGTASWFCPAGVTSVTVEAWGGGGAGGGITGRYSAAGGGSGGGYVRTTMAVSPGTTYSLTIGSGGTGTNGNGGSGGSSWFGSATTFLAVGGNGAVGTSSASTYTAGAAAVITGNIGGTLANFYGGKGADANSSNGSGGGGSSAGTAANGNAATGLLGGAAVAGGGLGGAGNNNGNNGGSGAAPGGGGGGANTSNFNQYKGGAGGNGKVTISYTTPGTYLSQLVSMSTARQTGVQEKPEQYLLS